MFRFEPPNFCDCSAGFRNVQSMASNVCPALRNAPKKDEKKYVENHLAACHCNDAPCQQRDNTMQLPRKRLKLKIAFSGSSSTASAMCLFKPETNQTTETISSSPSSQTESGGLRCATSVFHGVSMSYWILLNFSQSRSSSDPRPILFLWFSFWERERGVALLKWIIKIIQVR